jgi:hypothetical protein
MEHAPVLYLCDCYGATFGNVVCAAKDNIDGAALIEFGGSKSVRRRDGNIVKTVAVEVLPEIKRGAEVVCDLGPEDGEAFARVYIV